MTLDYSTLGGGFQTSGPPAGGGFDWGDLFQNKIFLSFLSQAGAGLAQNEAVSGINALVQQGISAKSASDLQAKKRREFADILAGINVPGKKQTMTIDGDGTTKLSVSGDKDTGLGGMSLESSEALTGIQPGKYSADQNAEIGRLLGGGGMDTLLRGGSLPSTGQSGASYEELAGLTAQDISRITSDSLKSEIAKSSINYQKALAAESRARIGTSRSAELRRWQESLRQSPLEVPGLGYISFEQWKSLDSKTKAYTYYVFDAKKNDEAALSYNEWERQTDPTTIKQIYDTSLKDKGFKEFFFKQKALGAPKISIGEKVKYEEAKADVRAKKFFTDPKGFARDVSKHVSSDEVQNKVFALGESDRAKAIVQEAENKAVSLIQSSGGKIVSSKVEGRTFIWTVEWLDGSTSEVKYAN